MNKYGLGLYEKNGGTSSIPLKSVSITGKVIGSFSDITARQEYVNESENTIEAVYTFPISDTASVHSFRAIFDGRVINGEIMDRKEASEQYENAISEGDSAFLLEQHRPNIFQISAGQIKPGEKVEIEISYIDEIKETDNEIRLLIPTVVSPRYIPGNARVPDQDLITPPIGNADYTVNFRLELNPLRKVVSYESPSHMIRVEPMESAGAVVSLANESVRLDRDFVLTMKLKSEGSSYALAANNEKGEGFIYAAFVPEIAPSDKNECKDNDYLFLIDISGSMSGEKLEQAKNALKICLRNLGGNDSFNIVAFENNCHFLTDVNSLLYNQKNITKATRWINELRATGGTEILEAIKFSLSGEYQNRTILLFTDGEVGNENEILKFVKKNVGGARIFTFGIDTSVNSAFINQLAAAGGGKPEFVYPGERIDDKVIRQFSRIASPLVDGIKVDWGGNKIEDAVPDGIRNIFDMEYTCLTARLLSIANDDIKLYGNIGEQALCWTIKKEDIAAGDFDMLSRLWARNRIRQLEEKLKNGGAIRPRSIKDEITKVSIEYGVMSAYTSFTAVAERVDKAKGLPITSIVPVMLPSMWEPNMRTSTVFAGPMPVISENFANIHCSAVGESYKYSARSLTERPERVTRVDLSDTSELLRVLARNQQADGAFCNESENDAPNRIKSTANALSGFALYDGSIGLYNKQLEKGLYYLIENVKRVIIISQCLSNIVLALKCCLLRDEFTPSAQNAAQTMLEQMEGIIAKEDVKSPCIYEILGCSSLKDLKDKAKAVIEAAGIVNIKINKLEKSISGSKDEADVINDVVSLCILLDI